MNLQQQSTEKTLLTTRALSKQLNQPEAAILKIALDLGFNPDNLTESEGKAIAQSLNLEPKPQQLHGKPEAAGETELDSLSLVAEADDLDLAADNVAQNVGNGGSIKQGLIETELAKTQTQAELLAHLNSATFADTYRRTLAENFAAFQEISDSNHDQFMQSIVAKFSELGKGTDPNQLPQQLTKKAEAQSQKTQAYVSKIRENFNPNLWN